MSTWQTDYGVMIANAKKESDRGCALVLAANLDNRLRSLLKSFFVEQSPNKQNGLFEGNGCLATFSSRIKVSFSVGLLGTDEQHDLDIIRAIRNDFAHNESSIDFSNPPVSDRCNSLRLHQTMEKDRPDIDVSKHSGRDKFQIVSVSLCLMLADRENGASKIKRVTPSSRSILPKSPTSVG